MKKSLLAFAVLTLASAAAFAQTAADSNANSGANASTGNIALNTSLYLPSANPFSYQTLGYTGAYTQTVKGQPVAAGAASFATPAVWRCATAGAGGALQLKDFALSFALPGGESAICPREFRIAIIGSIADRFAFANKPELSDSQKVIALDTAKAMLAQACGDNEIANSLERTKTMQCDEPTADEDRKARWARERQAKQVANTVVAPNGERVAYMPGVPAVREAPKPWQAGG